MEIRKSKNSRDFTLTQIESGNDKGKLLYSSGFPANGRVEVFDPDRIKRVCRRLEDRLRKNVGCLFDILDSQELMYDEFLK